MKLKIKLPFLFLLMFALIMMTGGAYMRFFVVGDTYFKESYYKDKYDADNQAIADSIFQRHPDMQAIAGYMKQASENQGITVRLYDHLLSSEILSYTKAVKDSLSNSNFIPIKQDDGQLLYFLEIERPPRPTNIILSSTSPWEVLSFALILLGLVFLTLTIYFHVKITKPLQALNARLKNVNIRRSLAIPPAKTRKDEIGELYSHFNEMEEKLHLAHKEQIDMICAIAHDLKTPLTSINGFVELLSMQKNLSEKEKQEYYELILKKSKHIAELISDFSAFTNEELILESIDMKPVEARKLFESIASEYETELSGLNDELIFWHTFHANQFLMMNEHMIRRVFGNLFSNAVRYGGKKDLKVYMNGYTQGNYACFQVEDNGIGAPQKELSSLFLKFFTVDKSRQSKSGGTGLGLSSCKSIIEHHGGEISAFHSEYGGLGIRFTLPLVP